MGTLKKSETLQRAIRVAGNTFFFQNSRNSRQFFSIADDQVYPERGKPKLKKQKISRTFYAHNFNIVFLLHKQWL